MKPSQVKHILTGKLAVAALQNEEAAIRTWDKASDLAAAALEGLRYRMAQDVGQRVQNPKERADDPG